MKKIFSHFLIFSFFFLTSYCFVSAEKIKLPTETELPNLSRDSIAVTIGKFVTFALGFVGALAVLMIVVGGIMYIVGRGDKDMTDTARDIIIWAVAGLVISLVAWVVVNSIVSI